ncbi:hypothetical protein HMPREF1624_05578 [Sporothrix schenckii ATCC 58251]|uniref:Defective in cullin neddylation protein n=1 Tax=Sporothrix schenckii (strain ATCC 58251 / de Perez 2211183) TaxID=1391915 RepID=U7PR72_SPOS1|nr:hypothetical protein HMPREF1624_05578 [Sporothrix schenckii ATCC 58251]
MPPLTATQRMLLAQFMQATGANERAALKALKSTNFKLDQAADLYFNNLAAGGGAISNGSEPKLDAMFDELRDPSQDAKDALGVESTMAYLTSLGLNPESGEVFVALELVQAPSLGEITRKGFVDGWKTSGSVTKEEQAKYITTLLKHFSTDLAYFKRVYRYTFGAGKEPDQRSMSLENAIEFWKVLFAAPGRPWKTASRDWTPLWIAFLEEKWTRSVNRDMWNQTLEFAIKCSEDETLGFWNEDGAWPSVIDDFVAWCNEKGYTGNKKDSMDTSE